MSKEAIVFFLGFFLVILPYLGVPSDWKQWGTVGAGVVLIVVGYGLRRAAFLRAIADENGEHHADSFSETTAARDSSAQTDV